MTDLANELAQAKANAALKAAELPADVAGLVERLRALHVWPQFVADEHADILLPRQTKGLYAVGAVAHEAADALEAQARQIVELEEQIQLDVWDAAGEDI